MVAERGWVRSVEHSNGSGFGSPSTEYQHDIETAMKTSAVTWKITHLGIPESFTHSRADGRMAFATLLSFFLKTKMPSAAQGKTSCTPEMGFWRFAGSIEYRQ
jgi:hypothetical protein